MLKTYTYKIDDVGGVTLFCSDNQSFYQSRYLQGDDANIFLDEIKDTEKTWEESTEQCKQILNKNFGNIEGHFSYIISAYF